eukprot:1951375-Pleurochrysis_carterae.AAC.2
MVPQTFDHGGRCIFRAVHGSKSLADRPLARLWQDHAPLAKRAGSVSESARHPSHPLYSDTRLMPSRWHPSLFAGDFPESGECGWTPTYPGPDTGR